MNGRPNIDDYLKAAKIISTCSKERLPYVLEILSKSGVEIQNIEDLIEKSSKLSKKSLYSKKNGFNSKKSWSPSSDKTTLRLQKAYDDGISFTVVSKISEVNRTTLYQCVYGERQMKEAHKVKVNEALDKIYSEGDF